ncbi:MAG: hypothetical protein ACTSQI_13260 [Candidatus Helarchaeota archaeon]
MKRGQKVFIGVLLFGIFLSLCPITNAMEGSKQITPGKLYLAGIFTPYLDYRVMTGSYSANGTIDAWLSDTQDSAAEYISTGIIPANVLWGKTGANGTFEVTVATESGPYYFYFGNKNGISLIQVDFNLDLKKPISIPGFIFVSVFFGLLAALGIFLMWLKLKF